MASVPLAVIVSPVCTATSFSEKISSASVNSISAFSSVSSCEDTSVGFSSVISTSSVSPSVNATSSFSASDASFTLIFALSSEDAFTPAASL